MIRSDLLERENCSRIQKDFLEFHTALSRVMESAAAALDAGDRSGLLQTAHQAGVLEEQGEDAVRVWDLRDPLDMENRGKLSLIALRSARALRQLCTTGSSPLAGLEESRTFLGSLCRSLADRLDWSAKRQLLGPAYTGADEEDLELSLSELPGSLLSESRLSRVQALLDFHDALLALRELFEVLGEVRRMADRLFPLKGSR